MSIWADLLSLKEEDISITANFFALGGHSLSVNKMRHKIKNTLGIEVSVDKLYTSSCIRELSESLEVFSSLDKAGNILSKCTEEKVAHILSEFDALCIKHKIPGAQLAIYNGGEKCFAEYSDDVEINENTLFRVGCNIKIFTMEIVLSLIEQGKVDLHGEVTAYLPFLNNKALESVTVSELLSHTHGLESPLITTDKECFDSVMEMLDSESSSIQKIYDNNEISSYGSLGYLLLGCICETVTGLDWKALFQEYVISRYDIEQGISLNMDNEPLVPLSHRYNPLNGSKEQIANDWKDGTVFPYGQSSSFGCSAKVFLEYIEKTIFEQSREVVTIGDSLRVRGSLERNLYAKGCCLGWFKFGNNTLGHHGDGKGHHSLVHFDYNKQLIMVLHTSISSPASLWFELSELLFGDFDWGDCLDKGDLESYCGTYRNSYVNLDLFYNDNEPYIRIVNDGGEVVSCSKVELVDVDRGIYKSKSVPDVFSFIEDADNKYMRINFSLLKKV
ncbi:hypothetical protein PSECIP111951_02070 [Pseudoalteromonas holothuriae]|uniref:Carrier domain-containing protein n=1 Tax=Pseudoalteromonas holothuriae TaxID=2963714 RepID=A0ABN8ULC1_9GAMM|nr:hypothetical protein PSECIP111951_02070 [Pseudoalteromonas sp. CIP111951]